MVSVFGSSIILHETCALDKHVWYNAGVMRGAGRQLLASILNLITFWVLGLPLAILLGAHYDFGIEGLWWALCITTSVQVNTLDMLIARQDNDRHSPFL